MKFSSSRLAVAAFASVVSLAHEARAQDTTLPYLIEEDSDSYMSRFGTSVPFFDFDNGEYQYTLPFGFRFFRNSYTQVNIGVNGLLGFGQSVTERNNVDLSNTAAPNNFIAAFWDDLYAGNVTTTVEGSQPNRVVIIEYDNFQTVQFWGEQMNWQFWLYESPPGRFEIHWGTSSFPGMAMINASMGFENEAGQASSEFGTTCSPNCLGSDFPSQGTIFRATLEAGEDLFAVSTSADVSGTPLRLYQGIPFDSNITVASFHQGDIGPFSYSLYLLSPTETEPSLPAFFTSGPITLTDFETRLITDSVALPLDALPGRYRIGARMDSLDQIMEPDETNNFVIGTQQFIVDERAPDLQVTSVLPDTTMLEPGAMVGVTFNLENNGNLETSADWRVVLSQNRAASASDLVVLSSSSPEMLEIGASNPQHVQVMIPANIRPGRYYFGVVVDPTNAVTELNETNNNARSPDAYDIKTPSVDIVTQTLPVAYIGVPYSSRLVAAGGDGTYVWEQTGGTLPAGLAFVAGPVGEIRGTPTEETSASLTFKVTSNMHNMSRTFMLDVHALGGPLTIVTRDLLPGIVGQNYPPAEEGQDPMNQQRLVAVGGAGTATFTLVSGGPAGLVVDSDGYIHGVPATRGTFQLEVSATDGTNTVMRTIPLTIVEPGRLTLIVGALPDATLGEPFSYTFFTVGQEAGEDLHYGIDASSMAPPGLALGISDGVLAGTPMQAGTYVFAVRVVEGGSANAPSDTASVTLRVLAPADSLSITPTSVPDAVVGTDYSVTFEARQGVGPFTWTTENAAGMYPAGLMGEVVEVDGVKKFRLSGKPTELPSEESQGVNTGGVFSFLLKLDDAQGRHAEEAVSLRILPATEVMQPTPTDKGGCGCNATSSSSDLSMFAALFLALALVVRRR